MTEANSTSEQPRAGLSTCCVHAGDVRDTAQAHAVGALVVVDNTLATPVNENPLHHTTLTASASRPSSAVGISGGNAPFAEFDQHGGVVDAQVFADSR